MTARSRHSHHGGGGGASEGTKNFRSRKLDHRRPIQVFRPTDVELLDDKGAGLSVPIHDVATGVEKEEEKELHLQQYMKSFTQSSTTAPAYIPTPDANQTVDHDRFCSLYPPQRRTTTAGAAPPPPPPPGVGVSGPRNTNNGGDYLPKSYIHYSTTFEETLAGNTYNMDEDDDEWLDAFHERYALEYPALVGAASPSSQLGALSPDAPPPMSPPVRSPSPRKGGNASSPTSVSPPRKRARTAAASPHRRQPSPAPPPPPPPPLIPMSEDAFELAMFIFETLQNENVAELLRNPMIDVPLTSVNYTTVAEAKQALLARPGLVAPAMTLGDMGSQTPLGASRRSTLMGGASMSSTTPLAASALPGSAFARCIGLGRPSTPPPASAPPHTPNLKAESGVNRPAPMPPRANDLAVSQIEWWLPHVYPWWLERRRRRGNKPVHPVIRVEEPCPKNETDAYACFRKRDVKVTRKTRRTETQAVTLLKKLRGELATARAIAVTACEREAAAVDVVEFEVRTFRARAALWAARRASGTPVNLGAGPATADSPSFAIPVLAMPEPVVLPTPQRAPLSGLLARPQLAQSLPPAAATAAMVSSTQRSGVSAPRNTRTSSSAVLVVATGGPSTTAALLLPPPAPPALPALAELAAMPANGIARPGAAAAASAGFEHIPSLNEVYNKKVESTIKQRRAAEDAKVNLALCPRGVFVPVPPPANGTSAGNTWPAHSQLQSLPPPLPPPLLPPPAWRAYGDVPPPPPAWTTHLAPTKYITDRAGRYADGYEALRLRVRDRATAAAVAGHAPNMAVPATGARAADPDAHASWIKTLPSHVRHSLIYPFAARASLEDGGPPPPLPPSLSVLEHPNVASVRAVPPALPVTTVAMVVDSGVPTPESDLDALGLASPTSSPSYSGTPLADPIALKQHVSGPNLRVAHHSTSPPSSMPVVQLSAHHANSIGTPRDRAQTPLSSVTAPSHSDGPATPPSPESSPRTSPPASLSGKSGGKLSAPSPAHQVVPWGDMSPHQVLASLFDPTSPLAAKVLASIDRSGCSSAENIRVTLEPLRKSAAGLSSLWAVRRRVGYGGRVRLERRRISLAGRDALVASAAALAPFSRSASVVVPDASIPGGAGGAAVAAAASNRTAVSSSTTRR
ncbi:hypothetical protein BC828DRAFT_417914 [Blastocladiella britannica]|nr:hypothetical protein BC828DRAFT_417914 [Blastocladiella britannica]